MRFGLDGGHHALRRVVRLRSSEYDLTRRTDDGKGRFGEHDESTTTVSDVSLHLFQPNEINVDTEHGERLGGDLQGLALPTADLQFDDRLSHGGESYEVEDIIHIPDGDDQVLKMFSLVRRTND